MGKQNELGNYVDDCNMQISKLVGSSPKEDNRYPQGVQDVGSEDIRNFPTS